MKAICNDTIVVGLAHGDTGDVDVPAELRSLPPSRLRLVSGAIVDAATLTKFYVDAAGVKHAKAGAGRKALTCAWDAEIVNDGGTWRVRSASEILKPAIKAECGRRIFAVASVNTQMNMTSARSAGRLSTQDAATYDAGFDWIQSMRARCAELISAADEGFASDDKWPPVPAGVAALAARF